MNEELRKMLRLEYSQAMQQAAMTNSRDTRISALGKAEGLRAALRALKKVEDAAQKVEDAWAYEGC